MKVYRFLKRAFSMFLILVLILSDIGGMFGMTTFARAEEIVTSLGSDNVSATPDDLLTFGEWLYWLEEDGTATVAGYVNTEETALSIPARLGSHPVTGIGHDAFKENSKLHEVSVPVNVTRIADDAFQSRSKLTISAYHGAYALDYAQKKGFATSCIESMAGVEFAEGVIDLAGLPKGSYRSLTDESVLFKANEVTFLQTGEVVMFPVSADYPNGLIRRVESIVSDGNELQVTLSEPDWGSSFQHVYGEQDLILDWENAVVIDCDDPDFFDAVVSSGALEQLGLSGDYSVQEIKEIPAASYDGETTETVSDTQDVETLASDTQLENDVPPTGETDSVLPEDVQSSTEALPSDTDETLVESSFAETWTGADQTDAVQIEEDVDEPYAVVQEENTISDSFEQAPLNNDYITALEAAILSDPLEPTVSLQSDMDDFDAAGTSVISASLDREEEAFYEESYGQDTEEPEATPEMIWNTDWEILDEVESAGLKDAAKKVKNAVSSAVDALEDFAHKVTHLYDSKDSKNINHSPLPVKDSPVLELLKKHKFSGGIDLTVKNGKVAWDVETKWLFLFGAWGEYPSVKSLEVKLPMYNTFTVSYEYKAKPEKLNYEKNLKEFTIEVPFAQVGPISGTVTFKWVTEFSGKFSVTGRFVVNVDYTYKNNKITDNTTTDKSFDVSLEGQFKTGPELDINLNLAIGKVGVKFTQLFIQGFFRIIGSATQTSIILGTEKTHNCLNAKVSADLTIGCKIGIIEFLGKPMNEKLYLEIKPKEPQFKWDIGQWHWDNLDRHDTCTLKKRIIIADTGTSCARYTCDVNKPIPDPNSPSKQGYKFLGWYVDTRSSGLPGSDYKLTFGSSVMPYCGPSGTLYIYAKFEKIPESVKVSSVTLNKSSATLLTTDKNGIQLTATVSPSNAADRSVTWRSSNTSVATVSSNGLVKPVGAGTAEITCTSKMVSSKSASCIVTVKKPPVSSLTLNKSSVSLTTRDQNGVQLQATLNPSDVDNSAVTWKSSNTNVVTVTSGGLVKVTGAGTATVTCTSQSNGSANASCTFTVTPPPVTGVTLDKTSVLLYTNNRNGLQLSASVAPTDAEQGLTWSSSDTSVVTVSSSGKISVAGPGTATVTATSTADASKTAVCTVSVTEPPVTGITLSQTEIQLDLNDTQGVTLTATVAATGGDTSVTWNSSNSNVATVDANGHVSMAGLGTAVITCTSVQVPDVFAVCNVTVVRPPVTSVALNHSALTVYTNDTTGQRLTATVTPSNAEPAMNWSCSDATVAVVYSDGLVKPVGVGTATITATSVSTPAKSASCAVTVVKPPVSGVSLSASSMTIFTDNTGGERLAAIVSPEDPDDPSLTWSSSNTAVAIVSADGTVVPVAVGTAVIRVVSVSNPNASAQCAVTVQRPPVSSVTFNQTTATLYIDNTSGLQLTATVLPAEAEDKSLVWTSSSDVIATVNENGLVLPENIGSTTITATSVSNPKVSMSCTVTVTYPPVNSVTLDRASAILATNNMEGLLLKATVLPAAAEDTSVTWTSSNSNVVSVDEFGMVAPMGQGTAIITARSNSNPNISASCVFNVKQLVERVYLTECAASLLPGETVQMSALVYPADATDRSVAWASSNPAAATVDANGLVTAVGAGQTTISATAKDGSGVSDSISLNIEKMLQLDLTQAENTVFVQGEGDVLLAYVSLTGASALRMAKLGEPLNWSAIKKSGSGDTVMAVLQSTITENDTSYPTTLVSLVGSEFPTAGSEVYTVSCSAGGYQDAIDVTVTVDGTEYTKSLSLTNGSETGILSVQENTELLLPGTPASTDGKPVPQNMSVSAAGGLKFMRHVTGEKRDDGIALVFDASDIYEGTVEYSVGNLNYQVDTVFHVTDVDGILRVRAEDLTLETNFLDLIQGESETLNVSFTPENVFDRSLIFISSDPTVATVDANGVVRAISPGVAYITCTATDGSDAFAMGVVKVEAYLQLDDNSLEYTVYRGGEEHADLGIVNVTINSERRLSEDNLNVTWKLERISGQCTELGIEEFLEDGETGISVSGNTLKLLRINGTGTDIYRLSCRAGAYSDSCDIRVNVVEASLPETVTLAQNSYSGKIGEVIPVNIGYTLNPSESELPENADLVIDGGSAFRRALSGDYDYTVPQNVIFSLPGTYSAELILKGTNYIYRCPLTFTVADENGIVPVNISDVQFNEGVLNLTTCETKTLNLSVEPAEASYSSISWSSTDTSVATVSAAGKVTAIGPGNAFIVAQIPEYDEPAICTVNVEEGLTFSRETLERTVFVDGETRVILDLIMLTENTSLRLTEEPQWTLRRKSGTSLTLRAVPYTTENDSGNTIYGCALKLYSVSKEGDTVYELICSNGTEETSATIRVHAVYRDRILPASISLTQTEFTADIGELIVIRPTVVTYPEGTGLPDGVTLDCVGDSSFISALNTDDSYVNQAISTFSFSRAGTYETQFVYSYSNIQYIVPVTFRIRDENGNIPVQTSKVSLNRKALYMTSGETEQMEAVFTPAEATNQTVSWSSSDETVVSVDANGTVVAVGNGTAMIQCVPADTELEPLSCVVTVEDYLTVETGATSRTLYLQGEQHNTVGFATLSVGTASRLAKAGVTPVWTLETEETTHTILRSVEADDLSGITADTDQLLSGGSDHYTIRCSAGDHSWSQRFDLNVVDLGDTAPQSVGIARTEAIAAVGEALTLDFTPVLAPTGASMPSGMRDLGFIGIGDFYDALDDSVYDEDGDLLTVAFTKPGQYVVAKKYVLSNLEYVTACTVTVGAQTGRGLLSATELEYTVYGGGRSGSVSTVSLNDATVYELWKNQMTWTAERISGNSMTVALKEHGDSVDVFVANVRNNGTDVWRISCSFGGMTESVDLTLTTAQPRSSLPESVELARTRFTGMIGNWISVPLGVICNPVGSMLPDRGDEFWSFTFDQAGEERSDHSIEDGMLRVNFAMGGYYTGTLSYRSGNVSYDMPVYFVIQDEEEEVRKPDLKLFLVNDFDTVYPEGDTGVAIAQVVAAETLSTYSTGASVAYMREKEAAWNITTSGSGAALSLEKVSDNVYNVMLNSAGSSGDVNYTVSCAVDGVTKTATKTLHVASAAEERPDPTLRQTFYQARVGETVSIGGELLSRRDASVLQARSSFDPTDLLAAVGYEIGEHGQYWVVTFYEAGTYTPSIEAQVSNLTVSVPITIVVVNRDAEIEQRVLKLPAALTEIGEQAFEEIQATVIDLRGTGISRIRANAFRNCVNVNMVYLPEGSLMIDGTAFYGCINAVFCCTPGSDGAIWAGEQGFPVVSP